MKRPYLIYVMILLQFAIFMVLGAAILGIQGERDLQRESINQLASDLIAIRDQVAYARADIVSKLPAVSEQVDLTEVSERCVPSSGVWTVYDDRRIHDYNVCFIERFRRQMQQMICTKGDQQTRQYNQFVNDWEFVGSFSC